MKDMQEAQEVRGAPERLWRPPVAPLVTRRRLVVLGAAAAGAALGLPAAAFAQAGPNAPKPLPGGIVHPPSGVFIHHYPPGPNLATMNEQSQITDFDGFVSNSRISGMGTGRDTRTGATMRLSFRTDMGFMEGTYVGTDGRRSTGTFGFICLDLFDGPVGTNQIHDYSPAIPASGLFWTAPIPAASVQVDLTRGTARMRGSALPVPDFRDVVNSLRGGPSVPATVSFDALWSGVKDRLDRTNPEQGWTGRFVETGVAIAWSARQDGFAFDSDPAPTSTSSWGMIGRERNGVFLVGAAALPRTGAGTGLAGPAGVAGAVLALGGLAGLALRRRCA